MNRTNQFVPPRFGTAVHALVWLAKSGGFLTSSSIACQIKSHATFLRRVLSSLVTAGIVEAKEGRDGGYSLLKPTEEIRLDDVYRAVKPSADCNPDCGEEGKRLDHVMETIFLDMLSNYTIGDLVEQMDIQKSIESLL